MVVRTGDNLEKKSKVIVKSSDLNPPSATGKLIH